MNILHMKYALEVAKSGSLNRASEKLFVAQPNLSRAIKDLEGELGITIFERSAKGMKLTHDGEDFVRRASDIVSQIDKVEHIYKHRTGPQQMFSLCSPKASYVADAFIKFAPVLDKKTTEAIYHETNVDRIINSILDFDYKLGIVRCSASHEKFYKSLFENKGLTYRPLTELSYILVMNRECPLAKKEYIHLQDLAEYALIAHGDPLNPEEALSAYKSKTDNLPDYARRVYRVFDRSVQLGMLERHTTCFMWASRPTQAVLDRYNLTWRKCDDIRETHKDFLIYRNNYQLTEVDQLFLEYLERSIQETMGN